MPKKGLKTWRGAGAASEKFKGQEELPVGCREEKIKKGSSYYEGGRR